MRIVTWNIQHGGGPRVQRICERLTAHQPDIAVITEFRNNRAGDVIRAALADSGLEFIESTEAASKVNTVLIAGRRPFAAKSLSHFGADKHRTLLATFGSMNVLGLYFPTKRAKRPVFEALCKLDPVLLRQRTLLIGDFNTGRHYLDEKGATLIFAEYFDTLSDQGWIDTWRTRHPTAREFTWFSSHGNGFRLDHAFASPSFDVHISDARYSHDERLDKTSDHSVLIVDIQPPEAP